MVVRFFQRLDTFGCSGLHGGEKIKKECRDVPENDTSVPAPGIGIIDRSFPPLVSGVILTFTGNEWIFGFQK